MMTEAIEIKKGYDELSKYKFDKETVERDFERFCLDWDIDDEIDEMDEEDRNDFKNIKRRITRVMRLGRLVYNEDETFTYYFMKPPAKGEEGRLVSFKRPQGGDYLAMDRYKEKESIHKLHAVIAGLIKMPTAYVSRIDDVDLKVFKAIVNLFLGS
jgi:hypothetical protein